MEQDAGSSAKSPPPRPIAPPRRSPQEAQLIKFKKWHADAFSATSAAMTLDEQGKKEQAFKGYQEALEKIDKAVQIAHSGGFPPGDVDKVEEMVYKMRMTRKEVLERVSDLQHIPNASGGPASTSSYLDGPATNPAAATTGPIVPPSESSDSSASAIRSPPPYSASGENLNLYGQLSGELGQLAREQASLRNPLPVNAQEVFTIPDNIQIYFISPDDNVLAPSYPSFLRIVVLNQDAIATNSTPEFQQPPAFLQVGDWTYPLVPGQSPVFHSNDGSYIFPDLLSTSEGANVGLILPPEISAEDRKSFEEFLLQLTGLDAFPIVPTEEPGAAPLVIEPIGEDEVVVEVKPKVTPRIKRPEVVEPELPTSTRISTRIAEGAETVAQGLIVGAEKTSEALGKGAQFLIGKMQPVEENPKISPQVKGYAKKAKTITGHTVQISGYLVSQLGRGTAHLGRKIAPYVHASAARIYAKTAKSSEADANQKMSQVLEVSGGALVGFGTVYMGLEHAAKVLASSIANNTVSVVRHRYGTEAGALGQDVASTVGNTIMTGVNVQNLGPKAIAKRAVKEAGKASLHPPQDSKPKLPK